MFRAHVLIIRRSKLHYTASGIITPIGGRLVYCVDDCLVCRSICSCIPDRHLHTVHETATYRCDDNRSCVMQFWPPDDEHMCSKHVEAWNKLLVKQKFCTSSWLITKINILRCRSAKRQNLEKPVEKIQVSLKSEKNKGYFTWRHVYILIISRWILLGVGTLSENIVEKTKTCLLFSKTFIYIYKLKRSWDDMENVVEPDRPLLTTQ